jgi:hypothetical protein
MTPPGFHQAEINFSVFVDKPGHDAGLAGDFGSLPDGCDDWW